MEESKFNVYLILIVRLEWCVPTCVTHTLTPAILLFLVTKDENFLPDIPARSKTPYKALSLTINFHIQLLRCFDDILLDISIAFCNNSCPGPNSQLIYTKSLVDKKYQLPYQHFHINCGRSDTRGRTDTSRPETAGRMTLASPTLNDGITVGIIKGQDLYFL